MIDRDQVRERFLPYLPQYLQGKDPKAKINGKRDVKLRCEDCETRKGPPLSVNLDSGLFSCHHCGRSGDLFDLIRGYECLDFPGALRFAADYSGIGSAPVVTSTTTEKFHAIDPTSGKPWFNNGTISATWDYTDEDGNVLFRVCKIPKGEGEKTFRAARSDSNSPTGWYVGVGGVRRVPYRLPDLIDAIKNGSTVYLCPGEKDADAVNHLDGESWYIATTKPFGEKWDTYYNAFFRDAKVIIVQDRDDKGRQYAQDARSHLQGIAASVEIVEAVEGKDAHDHVTAGYELEDFVPVAVPTATDEDKSIPPPKIVDLYGDSVTPTRPKFRVGNFLRETGLHLIWAQPGGYKTSLVLWMLHQLCAALVELLLGHPDLKIIKPIKRALIVTTEENANELRYVSDAIRRGMGDMAPPTDKIFHIFALDSGRPRITLDDLPQIIGDHGPFDPVILDSLTGLRPKLVDGARAKYDVDNDLANEQCLTLRALAAQYQMAFWLIHHSDKLINNYRGPVEWWASADAMMGLLADNGRIKVKPQKVRGGRVLPAFLIEPEWDCDALSFRYGGEVEEGSDLTPTAEKVLAFLLGRGKTPQYIIVEQINAARSTIFRALDQLEAAGLARKTGEVEKRSPVWEPSEPSDSRVGRIDGKKGGNTNDYS